MVNVTYLLGAGASYNCLPIVSQMSDRIIETAQWYDQITFSSPDISGSSEDISEIYKGLIWLADICNTRKNFSVDTYAKKLLISGDIGKYEKLKTLLSIYFTLDQKRTLPDVRYDNFWASIIDKKDSFPDNIKILSWNYDFQLELTYQDFTNSSTLSRSAKELNIITPKSSNLDSLDGSKFTIAKLNGSATLIQKFCHIK